MAQNVIETLQPKHHRMIRLFIAGCSSQEVGRAMGMTDTHVSIIRHSPVFLTEYERLKKINDKTFMEHQAENDSVDKAREILERGAEDAANALVSASKGEIESRVQVHAADLLTSKVGIKGTENVAAVVRIEAGQGLTDALDRLTEKHSGQANAETSEDDKGSVA